MPTIAASISTLDGAAADLAAAGRELTGLPTQVHDLAALAEQGAGALSVHLVRGTQAFSASWALTLDVLRTATEVLGENVGRAGVVLATTDAEVAAAQAWR